MRILFTLIGLLICFATISTQDNDFDFLRLSTPYVFFQPTVNEVGQQDPRLGIYLQASIDTWPLISIGRVLDLETAFGTGLDCFPSVPTFLGNDLEYTETGVLLYNEAASTPMEIRTTATVGTSWTAYTDTNTGYELRMEVVDQAETSFLGLTDQVKTISLQSRNSSNDTFVNLIPELKISQTYGLIQGADLWRLAQNDNNIPLVGINEFGDRDYRFEDFFELLPGDALHIREVEFTPNANGGFYEVVEQIRRVNGIGYDASLEAIVVNFGIQQLRYFYTNPGPNPIYTDSTFTAIPTLFEAYFEEEGTGWLNGRIGQFSDPQGVNNVVDLQGGIIQLRSGPFAVQSKSLSAEYIRQVEDSCYTLALDTQFGDSYYVGYAGPYYSRLGPQLFSVRELVFGNTSAGIVGEGFEWQDVFPSNTLDPVTLDNNLSVAPNPSMGFVNLSTPTNFPAAHLQVVDIHGRMVWSQSLFGKTQELDLTGLPKGTYQILLFDGRVLVGRKRVVLR